MDIPGLIGIKIGQEQGFLEDGTRVPLSLVRLEKPVVVQIKNVDKHGYNSVQIGVGTKKKVTKPLQGHFKKANLKTTPRYLKEIRTTKESSLEVGSEINPEEVLAVGDVVRVTGISKGKGYAGVVKRYHFKGGPKTHGQSDRHRAPGSSGQSTTPGRVYKGKRMSGRMGNETVSIKNLQVINLEDGILSIIGLIPGPKGSLVTILKTGAKKKFKPLFKASSESDVAADAIPVEVTEAVVVTEDSVNSAAEAEVAVKEEASVVEEKTEVPEKEEALVAEEKIEASAEDVKDENVEAINTDDQKIDEAKETVIDESQTKEPKEEKEEAVEAK